MPNLEETIDFDSFDLIYISEVFKIPSEDVPYLIVSFLNYLKSNPKVVIDLLGADSVKAYVNLFEEDIVLISLMELLISMSESRIY